MAQPFTPQIVVPAFFDAAHLADFSTVRGLAPAVAIVVLDANIGSSNPPDVNDPSTQTLWRDLVRGYQASGMTVLGYIPTNSGVGSAPSVPTRDGSPRGPNITRDDICGVPGDPSHPGYINQWYALTPTIDGIFFDEGPASYRFTGDPDPSATSIAQPVRSFYHAIYDCVQAKPVRPSSPNARPVVMLNASEYRDSDGWWIMENTAQSQFRACDIALLFEGPSSKYLVPCDPANPDGRVQYCAGPWWGNYPADRIAHTVHSCPSASLCQALALGKQRGAGYLYVFDGTSSAYNRLPSYWEEEVAVVALRDNNDIYVRDWTDSPSSYDQGREPSSGVFWRTSDVWNRLSNAPPSGGFFNANDQPLSESPQLDAGGNNTNFAFARLHRKPCGGQVTVKVDFLWADFGAGGIFQYVTPTRPSATVTFNAGDYERLTPGVQWSLPATVSPHICLAVEVYTAQDPLKNGSLNGKSTSVTGSLIPQDNNKAQRNLNVVRLPAPPPPAPPSPMQGTGSMSHFALVHNGDTKVRDITLKYEVEGTAREVLRRGSVEVITARGRRSAKAFKAGDEVLLAKMQPGEDRWVGVTFQLEGGRRGQLLPVTFSELVDGEVVNGFTVAAQLSDLGEVVFANLNLHAMELRRIAATAKFDIEEAGKESMATLELLRLLRRKQVIGRRQIARPGRPRGAGREYAEFLRAHLPSLNKIVSELTAAGGSRDPFGVEAALERLAKQASVAKPEALSIARAHAEWLYRIDPFLTMLQRQRA